MLYFKNNPTALKIKYMNQHTKNFSQGQIL